MFGESVPSPVHLLEVPPSPCLVPKLSFLPAHPSLRFSEILPSQIDVTFCEHPLLLKACYSHYQNVAWRKASWVFKIILLFLQSNQDNRRKKSTDNPAFGEHKTLSLCSQPHTHGGSLGHWGGFAFLEYPPVRIVSEI